MEESGLLISGGLMVYCYGHRYWPWVCAGWGVMFGLMSGSFFSKLYAEDRTDVGNIPFDILLAAVGIGFVVTSIGLIGSLVIAATKASGKIACASGGGVLERSSQRHYARPGFNTA
jgi:hypothetical protein